jgi:hypothetical protein
LNKRLERVDNQHPGASLLNRHPLHFFSAAASFLVPLEYDPDKTATPLRAVLNWQQELNRLVPTE